MKDRREADDIRETEEAGEWPETSWSIGRK